MNAIILPGVNIGNGAVIGAGSVVSKDVPDYALVGGVPAKILKMKYSEDEVKKFLKIAWWNWGKDKINKNKRFFYLSVEEFLDKFS